MADSSRLMAHASRLVTQGQEKFGARARGLVDPAPNCLVLEFGDSAVNLEMRVWINDPMNGRANVMSELLICIWDKFHEHGIEIPYPQRDLHLRSSDIGNLPKNGD